MKRIATLLLMCPLAAAAAEWRYDGQAAAGDASDQPAMTETEPAADNMNRSAGPAPADAPRSGLSMSAVRADKGDPDSILAAVGEPPITRWQYPGYVVYFENDLVITSVAGSW